MKFFAHVPRRDQRLKQEQERRERKIDRWATWQPITPDSLAQLRAGASTGGWTAEIHTGWTNGWCVVLIRTVTGTSMGGAPVEHACITLASQSELTWLEKQKLKNELFGADRTAVEVMPREADKIDAANSYHLWVFAPARRYAFGLGEGQL